MRNGCVQWEERNDRMTDRYEYIKWYLKDNVCDDTVVLLYEVDLENGRYATRAAEIFSDRSVSPIVDEGNPWITEAPVPTVDEINTDPYYSAPEFYAEPITRNEFETVYRADFYTGAITFPGKKRGR